MYLQITTKCNMTCDHCCYSCNKNGKHGDYNTILDAIAFAREHDDYTICIGGGEPTLHPRFFDILRHTLNDFEYVWMATNGSRTNVMFRLRDIIDGEDYDNDNPIYQENKLCVALSQDYFHTPIDHRIVALWKRRAAAKHTGYEIRDVSDQVKGQGRAKRNGYDGKGCVCSDIIIKPDGKLKACGCTKAPVIGDVWSGITQEYQDILYSDDYRDSNCWTEWRKAQ